MYLTPRQARASSEESVVRKGRRVLLDKIGVGVSSRPDQPVDQIGGHKGRKENTREGVRFERTQERIASTCTSRPVGFALIREQKTNKETKKAGGRPKPTSASPLTFGSFLIKDADQQRQRL
ncbi:hypothetical protein G5I_00639 [Acromyrmex echinatior]|uniref:Uncharacterized protein n=1 Tax=Acromyrmex echinatior TaxID=103372 RepID=F4W5E2_ACREC|nr:hypothetical protein G5I_00639 [Acromyrmex echinatior]